MQQAKSVHCSKIILLGEILLRVLRGQLFRRLMACLICSSVTYKKSVLLGKYCLISPLTFHSHHISRVHRGIQISCPHSILERLRYTPEIPDRHPVNWINLYRQRLHSREVKLLVSSDYKTTYLHIHAAIRQSLAVFPTTCLISRQVQLIGYSSSIRLPQFFAIPGMCDNFSFR